MKKLALILFLILALPLAAQEATLTAPEAGVTATKVKVIAFSVLGAPCNCATVTISYQANDGTEKRTATYANLNAGTFIVALTTVKAGETGTLARKINFRILSYLVEQNELTGVSLVP